MQIVNEVDTTALELARLIADNNGFGFVLALVSVVIAFRFCLL